MQLSFMPIPNIREDPELTKDQYLTTISNKQHCTLAQVKANECLVVDKKLIDYQGKYVKRQKGGRQVCKANSNVLIRMVIW